MKFFKHFQTICRHRHQVMKGCFSVGLIWQGLTHDLSKFSYTEFSIGSKYFQGNRSPNNAEREKAGFSSAWLHHKGRNKHHFEYWLDYNLYAKGTYVAIKMPKKYVVEMLMDRIAACKIYDAAAHIPYTDDHPLQYYSKGLDYTLLHNETRQLLEILLHMLAEKGEKETFTYIKEVVLKNKKRNKYN